MFLSSQDPKMQDLIKESRTKARIAMQARSVDESGAKMLQVMRDNFEELATLVFMSTRPSREQSLAITKLEEALMWTNKGIASGYPVTKPEASATTPPPDKL